MWPYVRFNVIIYSQTHDNAPQGVLHSNSNITSNVTHYIVKGENK